MNNKRIYLFALSGLVLLFLFYLAICYFSPKTMSVRKSVQIKCSKGLGFIMPNDIRQWNKWITWKNEDPDLAISPGGRFTSVGANFTFEGPEFGKGMVYLDEAYKDSVLVSYIRNNRWPGEVATYWQMIPESKTSLMLNTNSRLQKNIPFLKRPFYREFEADFNKRMEADLEALRNYIEGMVNAQFGVKTGSFEMHRFVGIKTPIPNFKMQKYYAESYPKIYKLLDSLKIDPSGPPVGMVFGWDGINSIVDLMAALPVKEKMQVPPGFDYVEIPTSPCIKLEHYGFYNTLKQAHAKLDYVMNSSTFTLQSPIIEEYVTSPSKEPDTSKWLTNIYYLLENKGAYAEEVKRKRTLEELVQEQEKQRKKKLGLIKK